MNPKNLFFFVLAVLIGCLMAIHRWGDSGHAIGMISLNGGKSRHPAMMESGRDHYSQITTVTVLPTFSGDVEVLIEGNPPLNYDLHLSGPVIDLRIHHLPELKGNIVYNLKAGDRLAIWTIIKGVRDNDSGYIKKEPPEFVNLASGLGDAFGCFKKYLNRLRRGAGRFSPDYSINGRYMLAFYDTSTGQSVLKIPLIFQSREQENARSHH